MQSDLIKRKISSSANSVQDLIKMTQVYDENTPDGLQKKLFILISYTLKFLRDEAVNYLTKLFNDPQITELSVTQFSQKHVKVETR